MAPPALGLAGEVRRTTLLLAPSDGMSLVGSAGLVNRAAGGRTAQLASKSA